MAHASYDCCAVCDCKMAFNEPDSLTKETLCAHCTVALAKRGIFVTDSTELLTWMSSVTPGVAAATLVECGFSPCYYRNQVDEEMKRLVAEITPPTSGTEGKA